MKKIKYTGIKVYKVRGLTHAEFTEILDEVDRNHSMIRIAENRLKDGGPIFKYVDAHYDLRTGTYFTISFRLFGKKTFSTVNRIEEPKFESLYKEIMDYLKNGESP